MMLTLPSAAKPSAGSLSLPAPTGGWNVRDALAKMPATDALFLDNLIPRSTSVDLREGCTLFATLPDDSPPAAPHNIRGLLSYSSPTGTKKFFATLEDGIYDITAGGTISTVASVVTAADWESVNISTAGGSFLWCCNGTDKSRYYDGAAWTVLDTLSTPALTGVVSADVTNVALFKARLILCCKNSLSFWYMPVNSVAGAASEFPLGALFTKGGYLVATSSWTLDGGAGPEDYFAAVTSEGEVAVYKGYDPSSAANWALVGIYLVGKPLSRRCFAKIGGDLSVMTDGGLYPLSKALLSATIDRRTAVSGKIVGAWASYTKQFGSLYGWQVLLSPAHNLLFVNVPILHDTATNTNYSYQFVMNTQNGSWCRFVGLNAEVWAVHDGAVYFANHNKVYKAMTGTTDAGLPIDARAKTAFFYPAGRGRMAQTTLLRLLCTVSTKLKYNLGIIANYGEGLTANAALSYGRSSALWDVAKWDEAYWGTGSVTEGTWKSVNHTPGHAIAVLLRVLAKDVTMSWNATDFIVKQGGML